MSDIKIQPSATGSATVTLTAPATGTARTVTLPDSTDTLAVNSDVTNKLPLAGGTLTGNLNIGSYTANTNADNLVIQEANDFTGITLAADNDQGSNIYFADPEDNNVGGITYNHSSNYMNFRVNGAEKMRIDSSGNLLVHKTSQNLATVGAQFRGDAVGLLQVTRDGGICLQLNRLSSDGEILRFYKDTTQVGSISTVSTGGGSIIIGNDSSGVMFRGDLTGSAFIPANPSSGAQVDNTLDVGHSAIRFDDIYASNGSINTSDRNEKQDIEELSEAEQRVAVACKGLMRKFRWKSAVAKKGDEARTHFGIIAQDLQDAFTAEGLDAGDYAMFISTTWWETQTEVPAVEAVAEVTDEDGNVTTEAVEAKDAYTRTDTFNTLEEAQEGATERTRLGVRYPELLAFIISVL